MLFRSDERASNRHCYAFVHCTSVTGGVSRFGFKTGDRDAQEIKKAQNEGRCTRSKRQIQGCEAHSGPRGHGSHNVRAPGSVGASATPSRVFKGMKLPGRMGGKRVTQLGLTVHSVDAEKNLLMIEGGIPGTEHSIVTIRHGVKGRLRKAR